MNYFNPIKISPTASKPLQKKNASQNEPAVTQAQPSTNLIIGAPNNRYEREADAMADRIMRMPQTFSSQPISNGANSIQRACAACAHEDEQIRRKPLMMKSEGGTPVATPALSQQLNSSKGGGNPLSSDTGNFMSKAFGRDFSGVRVHTGSSAVQMNQGLNARAFAHGSDIYFNSGEYRPNTSEGKRLLGHELTHVVQQSGGNMIQRSVARSSRCAPNVNGAGANPLVDLELIEFGSMLESLSAALQLSSDGNTSFNNFIGGRQRSTSFVAYLHRFGEPEQLRNGRFRNRFNRRSFADKEAAIDSELNSLSDRFSRLASFFTRNLRYRCVGTRSFTLPGCRATRCGANQFAAACRGSSTIAICPTFWGMSSDDQKHGLIHEACHAIFGFGDPAGGSMTTRRRGRNPVCYSGLVAEINGTNPPDPDCPALP